MDNKIESWRQGRFISMRKYSKMGEEWVKQQEIRESTLVRPSATGNPILQAASPEIAIWVAERLNLAAKLEKKIKEILTSKQ